MRRLKYLAIPAVLAAAALAFAATKFPSVVLSRATLGSYTSTVAGSLSTAEVVEWGHFGFWQYSPSSTSAPDNNTVIEPSDNPASGRWLLQGGQLSGSVTFHIQASGGDFTDPAVAWNAVSSYGLAANTDVTLQMGCDYTVTDTAPIIGSGIKGGREVNLQGCTPTTYSVTSIASSSGSAGAWSYVLQMSASVAAINANNDYLLVYGASGGTNPSRLDGACYVTAVNTGSNQVTCTNYSRASAAASGSVAASADDISSVIKVNGADGLRVWDWSTFHVQDIAIIGNNTAGTNGLSLQDNGRVHSNGDLIIGGFGNYQFDVIYNGEFNSESGPIGAFGGGREMNVFDGGTVQMQTPSIFVGASGVIVNVQNGGVIDATGSGSTKELFALGGGSDGVSCSGGSTLYANGEADDNSGYGIDQNGACSATLASFGFSGNNGGSSGKNCYPDNNVCQAATLPSGAILFGPLCFNNDLNSCVSTRINGANAQWSNANGLLFSGGDSIDICGSYTNVGSNWLQVCGTLQLSALTTAGILVNNTSGNVSNDTSGVACSGTPTSSFATDSHGIVTHC